MGVHVVRCSSGAVAQLSCSISKPFRHALLQVQWGTTPGGPYPNVVVGQSRGYIDVSSPLFPTANPYIAR